MTTAKVLIWVIRIIEWCSLGYLGFFLYKTFKFPSLPWIGAYFLANWIPKLLMPFIMAIIFKTSMFRDDIVKASIDFRQNNVQTVQAVITLSDWVSLLNKMSYLLLTLLVISEVINIIQSKISIEIPRLLELTLAIRRNVNLVGASVVLITLFAHFFSNVALYKMLFRKPAASSILEQILTLDGRTKFQPRS